MINSVDVFLPTVDPPSHLRFTILNENMVEMSWVRPLARIDGYRILVTSDTGGFPARPTSTVSPPPRPYELLTSDPHSHPRRSPRPVVTRRPAEEHVQIPAGLKVAVCVDSAWWCIMTNTSWCLFKLTKCHNVTFSLSIIHNITLSIFPLPEELDKELSLHSSATKTSITDLRVDVDYTVLLSSYSGARESVPISGLITSESPLTSHQTSVTKSDGIVDPCRARDVLTSGSIGALGLAPSVVVGVVIEKLARPLRLGGPIGKHLVQIPSNWGTNQMAPFGLWRGLRLCN